jgi:hypothetical protein
MSGESALASRPRAGMLIVNNQRLSMIPRMPVKIKVIRRKGDGFNDLRYFALKIYQAFYN